MTNEITIRSRLAEACSERGVKAEISKAFDVHPSTVKRWLEGEIPSPILKLLDWYFFGTMPPTITATLDLPGCLEFSRDEWRIVEILARRAGQTPGKWIATTLVDS